MEYGMSSNPALTALGACIACGSSHLWKYLDLGDHPPSNDFPKAETLQEEKRYPLGVQLCRDCGLSQLTHVVPSSEIFDDYAYLASSSKPLRAHYAGMVADILTRFVPPDGALCLDIGANDGITLSAYPSGRFRAVGIEPSNAGKVAVEKGFTIIDRFLDHETVGILGSKYGKAHIITATNVMAHIPDLPGAVKCIKACLHEDGVFVAEFPYLIDTMEQLYFDTIYHEHVSYLTLTPLVKVFDRAGLRLFDAQRVDFGASGPAIRIYGCLAASHRQVTDDLNTLLAEEGAWGIAHEAQYNKFSGKVLEMKAELVRVIDDLRENGKSVGVMSAPAKGNTLLNYCGLDHAKLVAVAENNARKIGRVTPGSHIPIVDDETFLSMNVDYALLLSWNYADYFVQHSDFAKRGGKFIIPLPSPHIRPN